MSGTDHRIRELGHTEAERIDPSRWQIRRADSEAVARAARERSEQERE